MNWRCFLGFHSCTTQSDDEGVWGECVRCKRRFGYVSRDVLRRLMDAEIARAKARQQMALKTGDHE